MKVEISTTVTNNIKQVTAGWRAGFDQVVRKTAFDLVAGAMDKSDVDTGAMRAGWYAITGHENQYSAAVEAARAADENVVIAPQVREPQPLEAMVANATAHAIHKEYGTTKMAASPMVHPTADQLRPGFDAAVAQVLKRNV